MKRKKSEEGDGEVQEQPQKRTRSGTRTQLNGDEFDELGLTAAIYITETAKKPKSTPLSTRQKPSTEIELEGDNEAGSPGNVDEEKDSVTDNVTPLKMRKGVALSTADGAQSHRKSSMKGKNLFATPKKTNGTTDTNGTPTLQRHADRSARRKSTRSIIERTVLGNTSDNDEEDEDLAQHIYGSEEENDHEQTQAQSDEELMEDIPATPSKRGRKKGSKNRIRSPTPPQDLPPHELYFSQNRTGRSKTSNNNLSSLALLDHEEYFTLARAYQDPHAVDLSSLQDLHITSFNQWNFELSQGFNICLFGWGSKRSLLIKLAEHIYEGQVDHNRNKIVIVNGYVHNLTIRDILNTVAAAVLEKGTKLGSQPAEMLERLTALLEEDKSKTVTIILNSIDGVPLRRPTTQTILSRLSSHPQIRLVASADHPSFPLLWDSSLRSAFNFLFHDCTTYDPYSVEVDVVDEVHELLGRSGRRVGGKEGVSFVLKSLPENAKNLFRVLIGEQLAALDEAPINDFGPPDDDEDNDNEQATGSSRKNEPGVEYRVLYQKAVEEFICSNEMNFRTLLKEFHDHQMIQSRKDALGTEMLSVPFRREELETILEDIAS